MEIFLIRVLQFMLAISLLVLLHEGGHFFFAKLFGVRVDKFYIFFDWKFSLFKFKPKNSDTEYGIGWLPLGGYCKIAGMIDESFDTEQMKQPVQDYEFRSKPAWQRLLIMIGGVLVNFLLALFIYGQILFWWGDTYIPVKDMTMGMKFNQEAKSYGFKDGDILVGTDTKAFKDFSADLYRDISEAKRVDILRDGKPMSISLPGDLNLLNMIKADPAFVRPLLPARIDSVMAGSPAEKAGLKAGNHILALNGAPVDSYNEFIDLLGRREDLLLTAKTPADSLKARTVTIVFGSDAKADTATVVLTPELKLGFFAPNLTAIYEPVTVEYGFLESIPAGIKYGWHVLASYVDDMKYVFSAEGAKSLGGFGAIGSLFPPMWDWYMFWKMTAFLSIILAFMNILPIPALDGGHVLFLLYEMITRRKPSEEFMIRAEYVGFGLLILLMVVANLNDILRWLGYL
ncbi:MAG: RIP metalloprotease RseP [Prevotella sp.]|jgi:regulator of sigma E protease|nr:RIP metalloprotease RseP [Prevotella sp.]MBQ5547384.1 RIP metalloprotease RseP [Prevotella sp.]